MKPKFLGKLMVLLAACGLAGAASAATVTWTDGQKITYDGATATWDGSELVLKFTSSTGTAGTQTGSLKLPSNATADILVVGGGGSGGSGRTSNSQYYGKGGDGGQVIQLSNQSLASGTTYSVSVGNGGSASNAGSTGNDGVASSIKGGALDRTASGGNGGARRQTGALAGAAGSGATGDYGQAGPAPKTNQSSLWTASAGTANTGSGGQGGGYYGSRYTIVAGGAGGSGIVVVRIKQMDPPPSVTFQGQTIYYTGGTYAWDGDELVFTYTEDGSLQLPLQATVDYLVVGGGGSGARGSRSGNYGSYTYYYGSGGNGGEVKSATDTTLAAGEYTISVGDGGAAPTSNNTAGESGDSSSLSKIGGSSITAAGGAGGSVNSLSGYSNAQPGSPATGTSSSITGTPVTYGQGGAKAKENAAADTVGANTGTGGQGSRYGNNSGTGGSGIVIVRVKSMLPVVNRTAEVYIGYPQTFTDFDGTVQSVKSSDSSKASVTQDGNTVTISGIAASMDPETVTVTTDTTVYKYAVTVKNQRELAQTVDLAKGPNSATIHTETFDQTPTLTASPSTSVATAAVSGNAVTFTAVGAGTTTAVVTCLMDGIPTRITYTIKVTAKEQDVVQVGDGYVTYEGASDVQHVGNDLVLIYTNPAVAGSFEIPAPFSAKIDVLAVGGGGAGGTVASGKGQGGGGGGAGGYTYKTNILLAVGVYNVGVGAGGAVNRDEDIGVGIPGAVGQPSVVTNNFGYTYASASGGGGGGTSSAQMDAGQAGGSGGGAAWYGRKAGAGGMGMDGQGFAGGSPTTYSNGGAGGGAAGAGHDWNQAGAGKSNDITGTAVTYAAGGMGGQGSGTTPATAGNGPGFGGNGGNGGLGANGGLAGAGGDGVVIVRIRDVSKSVKVPLPTVEDILRARYEWADDATYKGLDYEGATFTAADGRVYNWSDAISYVSGTTNVACSLDGETKVGIGYYNFTIYLRDGFVWDTEPDDPDSYGSTDGQSHRWRIVEDLENVDAEISVKKSVINQNGSNATVRVESFSSPEQSGKKELNVLFLGTRCQAHGLDPNIIKESINTVSRDCGANIDFFLYDKGNSTPVFQGHVDAGGVTTVDFSVKKSCHHAIKEFYQKLDAIRLADEASGKKTYDYIIFEVDGSRIAETRDTYSAYANEAAVSEWIKSYYQEKAVVWIVDACMGNSDSTKGEPFGGTHADYEAEEASGQPHVYWTPNSAHWGNNTSTYVQELSFAQYKALLGLFDPVSYEANKNVTSYTSASFSYVSRVTNVRTSEGTGRTIYCGNRYEVQTDYNHLDRVTELLKKTIKIKPYNLDFRDKIVDPSEGLTITNVSIVVCTNGTGGVASTDPADWVRLMGCDPKTGAFTWYDTTTNSGIMGGWMAVNTNNNEVTACFSNVDFQVWSKLDIDVVDDGRFRTSDNATYNNTTGEWEKNPNEGQAVVEMTDISGGSSIGVEGRADTAIPMTFKGYRVLGTANHGAVFVNGSSISNNYYVSEGSTVPVYYRGYGGYMIKSVTIDGVVWGEGAADSVHANIDEAMTNLYTFVSIAQDHTVHVEYEKYYGGVTSSPVTNAYDGTAHLIEVSLDGDWNSPYETEIRYSLVENADPGEYMNETDFLEYCRTNNLAKTVAQSGENGVEIFYEVFANQPGYGENFEEGWVWVDMGLRGSNYSVITPRELVVTPKHPPEPIFAKESFPDVVTDWGGDDPSVPWTVTGFIEGEDESVLDTTGWAVASNGNEIEGEYIQATSGIGQYKTHMVGVDADDVDDGNYVIVVKPGLLDVEKIAIDVDNVPQGPQLDPEVDGDTGVKWVIRVYDGTPTNITVTVTTSDITYETYYSVAGEDGKPTEWRPFTETSPMVDAGTNKVWYAVNPTGTSDAQYFAATNYSYVITLPRPITIQAETAEKVYDGTPLTSNACHVVEGAGTLAVGDALSAWTVEGSRTDVGVTTNAMKGATITNSRGDATANYDITFLDGLLTVTKAPIYIDDEPHSTDPSMPNDYGKTGVEDVEIFYNGEGTNIIVNVTKPNPEDCTVMYSTNGVDWVDTIAFTNVGVYQVWFSVQPPADLPGYVAVTNYAYVTIKPLEVVVTADDKEGVVGMTLPTLTAHVDGLLDSEKDRVAELIHYDIVCTNYTDAVGTYTGAIEPYGDADQGNYHVTYVPGTLTLVTKQRVVELWIVDHDDPGYGKVHLAFEPTLNGGRLADADLSSWDIKVKCAPNEEGLVNAELRPIVGLRADPTGAAGRQDIDRGWVWITVNVPDDASSTGYVAPATGPERCWKIVISLPDSE